MDPFQETPEEEALISDVERMKIAWRNEKAAPEILAYQADLIYRLNEQIQLLEGTVADTSSNHSLSLQSQLYSMDVNRATFLVRSYLKVRLCKIEEHALQISNSPDLFKRLSENEQEFARSLVDSLGKHFGHSFLDKLPRGYRSMLAQGGLRFNNQPESSDMIPEAPLDSFVFCRTKCTVDDFQLDDIGDETVSWLPDELYILRYRMVRRLLENNMIQLI